MTYIPDRQLEPDTAQEEREMSTQTEVDDAIGEYLDTGYLPDGRDTSPVLDRLAEQEEGLLSSDLLRAYRRGNRESAADIAMRAGAMLDDIVNDLVHKGLGHED